MGWKVIQDNINTPEEETYRKDREYDNYQGGQHKWRLKDDDGEIYYYILSDCDPNEGDEEEVFAPLDWAEADAGCTTLEYKNKDTGKYEII